MIRLATQRSSRAILELRRCSPSGSGGKLDFHGLYSGTLAAGAGDAALIAGRTTALGADREDSTVEPGAAAAAGCAGATGGVTRASMVLAGAVSASIAAGIAGRALGCFARVRRHCALNHNRSASSETATPILASPSRIARSGAPAFRIFNSSARWVSSWEIFGFFGWRHSATNWASVGRVAGVVSWSGGVVVGMVVGEWWEHYSHPFGRAMGALWSESKPRGLDVGVPAYCFLSFFPREFTSSRVLLRFDDLIPRLARVYPSCFGEWVQWVRLDSKVTFRFCGWIDGLIPRCDCPVSYSFSSFKEGGGESC